MGHNSDENVPVAIPISLNHTNEDVNADTIAKLHLALKERADQVILIDEFKEYNGDKEIESILKEILSPFLRPIPTKKEQRLQGF